MNNRRRGRKINRKEEREKERIQVERKTTERGDRRKLQFKQVEKVKTERKTMQSYGKIAIANKAQEGKPRT